jgi:hypothetical protein
MKLGTAVNVEAHDQGPVRAPLTNSQPCSNLKHFVRINRKLFRLINAKLQDWKAISQRKLLCPTGSS